MNTTPQKINYVYNQKKLISIKMQILLLNWVIFTSQGFFIENININCNEYLTFFY